MPTVKAGPFDVDYVEAGSGPAVLLVHSSASGNRQWRRLTDDLKDRYRVIALNLFGYGQTSKWPEDRPQTLADQAALITAVAGLAPERVALVGHSLGGAVAFEAALQLGPRLRTLVVFEPILFYLLHDLGEREAFAEISAIRTGFVEHGTKGDWNAVGELFVDYWSGKGAWAATPEDRKSGIISMLAPVMREWEMVGSQGRPIAEWGAISAPVHILRAADTRRTTGTVAALLARTHPNWRLHDVAAGGHMAPIARPDLVNPLIARVLDETR
ncbi:MAG: alpha/beta hydrolase [Xanthobacteraceae bacterium]